MAEYQSPKTWDDVWKDNKMNLSIESQYRLNEAIIIKLDRILKKYISQESSKIKKLKLIELGSGSGFSSQFLCDKYKLECHLLDFSTKSIVLAKRLSLNFPKNNTFFHKENILNLSSKHVEKYDIVVSIGVNEHFKGKDRKKIFDVMHQILKKGGLLVIIVPNNNCLFYTRFKEYVDSHGVWSYGYEEPFSRRELRSLVHVKNIRFDGFGLFSSIVLWKNRKNLLVSSKKNISEKKSSPEMLRKIYLRLDCAKLINSHIGHYLIITGKK